MEKIVVLGRFQPFHKGHEHLVKSAASLGKVTIAIGSSEAEQDPDNPWSKEERTAMVKTWANSVGIEIEVVCIPDLNDPPNWVKHATNYHGDGALATSDEITAQLYRQAGWKVHEISMSLRENLQGWRVRQTMKMLSMLQEEDVLRNVLQESLPDEIINWFIADNERIRRLAFLGPNVETPG
ncbi:MAG: adenylyltransferase/cytidyltransferase family protein [Euryarchaeota archaeon]|jgi:cytidyltransferase-like protein|nr:adenylyltransferase/cytidyltransferase family protein [Euryarchaeota archaeon]MBT4406541.1 adenylyltransferase/cytidyltransferase family protein [Euryarchaeota archaeon]